MNSSSHLTRRIILICFFATGVTGLVYEIVWTRMLILAFGSTQFAVTTVLTAFMAGLAFGSLIFGRIVDSYRRPVVLYGLVELTIGIYSILTPFLFSVIKNIYLTHLSSGELHYASFSLTQFLLSFACMITPTILMGGTLPILIRYITASKEEIGFTAGMLYSINTLGAVIGCTITGFYSLYIIGVNETVYTAGIVDIIIGALVIALSRGKTERETAKDIQRETVSSPADYNPLTAIIILAAFAISGFAALAYEVFWFRIFSLVIGSSIYAFTIMLATFLIGIGIGSLSFAPFIDKRKNPILWFAILEFIIGLSVLLTVPVYKELPYIFLEMFKAFSSSFWIFLAMQSFLCSLVMIIPTLCMGAIFPTVGRIYAKDLDTVGRGIGNIYFFNTAGAIFGSFIGGFILIPSIGIQKAIILLTGINILLGITILLTASLKRAAKGVLITAVMILFLITVMNIPPWDRVIMTTGPYVNPSAGPVLEAIKEKDKTIFDELLFYKEGINAVITVRREGDGKTISYQSNGKYEARTVDSKPGKAWSLLGHIPALLSKRHDRALLIGLGSGITLGAMEQYPFKEIDVAELEPAVVEAAGYFSKANTNALDDPRARLHIADGRNFLFAAEKRYDVIVSAVSDPWITGVSNLFTKEYFDGINSKLTDDGIAALWFQNYRISIDDLKTGLNTFASAFPHVSLWFHYSNTSDLIVIGSKTPHAFEIGSIYANLTEGRVKNDLARLDISNPFDILSLFLMGDKDMREYIRGAGINTDNRPILEFTLPRLLYSEPGAGANDRVMDILSNTRDFIPPVIVPANMEEDFYYQLGIAYASYAFRTKEAIMLFEKVLKINPEHKQARQYIALLRNELKDSLIH